MSKETNIQIYETLKGFSLGQTPGTPPQNLKRFRTEKTKPPSFVLGSAGFVQYLKGFTQNL